MFNQTIYLYNKPNVCPQKLKLCQTVWIETYRLFCCIVDNYKDLLLSFIDAENLPACYGGTLTDPDGNANCTTMVRKRNNNINKTLLQEGYTDNYITNLS